MRIGAVGLMAVAAITGATSVMAADGSENSGRPPWASEGEPLFEMGALGALAVGGRFNVQGLTNNGSSIDTRVSVADRGAFAVTAAVKADPGTQYELFYSREATALSGRGFPSTDVTIEYLHLGGTLVLDDEMQVKPYAAGGLGVTRLTPSEVGSTDTRFSLSFGLGLKWPVTRNFSLRVEGRGFLTLVDSNTATFCRSDQAGLVCLVRGNGTTFLQGQLLAGASFAF